MVQYRLLPPPGRSRPTADRSATSRATKFADPDSRERISRSSRTSGGDTQRVQLRVEVFNAFNQVRYGQPNGTIGGPTFGQITAADDGRIVQLGISDSSKR